MKTIKKMLALLLCSVIVLVPVTNASASGINVIVNGTQLTFDQPPIMQNNRTLVPFRAIFEAIGATVDWDQDAQTVTAEKGDVTITLEIGSSILNRNGTPIALDVPAQVVNNRTLVPTRAVVESFGAEVGWAPGTRTVTIWTVENPTGLNVDELFAAFAPDTPMITAGGLTVTWEELFPYVYQNIISLVYSFGTAPNLNDTYDGVMTIGEALLHFATEEALDLLVIRYGAGIHDVTPGQDGILMFREHIDEGIDFFGSEEALSDVIWGEAGISSLELYEYIYKNGLLPNTLFSELFGENGELHSADDLERFAQEQGFMMAKHILFLASSPDELTAVRRAGQNVLNQLRGYRGNDFDSFFDELMYEHTDDFDALQVFPNGYLFQEFDMVEEFHDACAALRIGEISGLVETAFGVHIIYRLPLDFDETPIAAAGYGQGQSLREIVFADSLSALMREWRNALNHAFSAEYESINLAEMLRSLY